MFFASKDNNLLKEIKKSLDNHPGFYSINHQEPVVSEVESKIRKEVVASVEELVIEVTNHYATDRAQVLVKVIQDRLNLLWNEQ